MQDLELSRFFKALGDASRLRIVALLSHGELCVCHVQDALGLTQPNASRQLGILRSAGVVEARRAGTWTWYSLARQQQPQRRAQLRALSLSFARDESIKRLLRRRRSCP